MSKKKTDTVAGNDGYETVIVRVPELMQFFGIAERTVYDWGSKGMPGLGNGLYNFAAVVKWRIEQLTDDLDEAKKGDATLYYLKQETQKRIILQKELEIQKMSGKLIDASMVKVAWVSEMRMISRKMSALAYRLNALLNGDPEQLERIKSEVDTLRDDIVKTEFRMHEDEEVDEEELKAISEINMEMDAAVMEAIEGDTDDDE